MFYAATPGAYPTDFCLEAASTMDQSPDWWHIYRQLFTLTFTNAQFILRNVYVFGMWKDTGRQCVCICNMEGHWE